MGDIIVDEGQELVAGGVDFLQVGDVGVQAQVFSFLLQHFAVADDLVERRAEVVTDAGKDSVVAGFRVPGAGFGASRG